MNNKEIDDLQRKRFNLQIRIKDWVDSGKDARELVKEYNQMVDTLRAAGVKAEIRAEYLKMEYWDKSYKPAQKSIQSTNIPKYPQRENEEIKQEKNDKKSDSFILCLAWTSIDSFAIPVQVQKVKEYFGELGMDIEAEENKPCGANCTEHILKYKFEGSEDSFRLLKICTQFVLDSFAESDFDRFNIAVFGKRKNY